MSAPCCLQEVVLEALTVPVLVYNQTTVLFANAEFRHLVCADSLAGTAITSIISPDIRDAAAERRRLVLNNGTAFDAMPIKPLGLDGHTHKGRASLQRVRYKPDSDAVLLVMQEADGREILRYRASQSESAPQWSSIGAARCLHSAAFESLPVPVVVSNRTHIVKANHASREALAARSTLDGEPLASVIHPDFADAGAQRRSLVLDHGQGYRNAAAKLKRLDGGIIHITVDGVPTDYAGEKFVTLVATDVR